MSREYYLVCDECRKKVHLGCVGFSGFQCWTSEINTMAAFRKLLGDCMFHFEKLKFVWEQTAEADEYAEVVVSPDGGGRMTIPAQKVLEWVNNPLVYYPEGVRETIRHVPETSDLANTNRQEVLNELIKKENADNRKLRIENKALKDLAPTSQWRDIKDASHNEHWILACNDELSHSFTAAWSNRHQCFLDWNGDKIKVTQWKPLDAPPTKDLAAAEGEKGV